MAKMFYSLEETTAKLNVAPDKLKEFVDHGKLREFRDGVKVMYKVDQVDLLLRDMSGGTGSGSGSGVLNLSASSGDSGIALAGDSSAGTKIPSANGAKVPSSSGTAVGTKPPPAPAKSSPTTGPIMVFDEREVKPTDASAQTHITSPVYDAISPSGIDSVGSGSGLLDLTRESDNTSLGAELLDEIYPGEGSKAGQTGIGSASSGVFDRSSGQTGASVAAVSTRTETTGGMMTGYSPMVEAPDSTAGIFGGFALAAILAMTLTIIISAAGVQGFEPGWLHTLASNLLLFAGILVLVALLFGFVGFFAGRAASR